MYQPLRVAVYYDQKRIANGWHLSHEIGHPFCSIIAAAMSTRKRQLDALDVRITYRAYPRRHKGRLLAIVIDAGHYEASHWKFTKTSMQLFKQQLVFILAGVPRMPKIDSNQKLLWIKWRGHGSYA